MTAAGVNVSELYLDLFVGVDGAIRRRVVSNFGSDAYEGWEQNRPEVELTVGNATGRISKAEYMGAAFAEVEDSRQHVEPPASGRRFLRRVLSRLREHPRSSVTTTRGAVKARKAATHSRGAQRERGERCR